MGFTVAAPGHSAFQRRTASERACGARPGFLGLGPTRHGRPLRSVDLKPAAACGAVDRIAPAAATARVKVVARATEARLLLRRRRVVGEAPRRTAASGLNSIFRCRAAPAAASRRPGRHIPLRRRRACSLWVGAASSSRRLGPRRDAETRLGLLAQGVPSARPHVDAPARSSRSHRDAAARNGCRRRRIDQRRPRSATCTSGRRPGGPLCPRRLHQTIGEVDRSSLFFFFVAGGSMTLWLILLAVAARRRRRAAGLCAAGPTERLWRRRGAALEDDLRGLSNTGTPLDATGRRSVPGSG